MTTVADIWAAWQAATAAGGARFYAEFEHLTGFTEADVKRHFGDWNRLSHETAEAIAADHGISIREGGFYAYLASIKLLGHPPIAALVDNGPPEDPNPRVSKRWPASEDCPGCPGRAGPKGRHKFGCPIQGAKATQLVMPVSLLDEE